MSKRLTFSGHLTWKLPGSVKEIIFLMQLSNKLGNLTKVVPKLLIFHLNWFPCFGFMKLTYITQGTKLYKN